MMTNVPYIGDDAIETIASNLIRLYGKKFKPIQHPPVPVEDIFETYHELTLEIDDLRSRSGVHDAFGALYVGSRRIVIDESLVPEENPGSTGRYLFTVAHEGGHWMLHHCYPNYLKQRNPKLAKRFEEALPSVICRTSERRTRLEIQADIFAACLLMPKSMVFEEWSKSFGSLGPPTCDVAVTKFLREADMGLSDDVMQEIGIAYIPDGYAKKFQVSPQAMRIRLERLGLLRPVCHSNRSSSGVAQ